MKRSTVNKAVAQATEFFTKNGWTLPPKPKWDVTDFGLGNFNRQGLTLINLAEEPEYCEKLMYARKGQTTPCHSHKKKKEDIISRKGALAVQIWDGQPESKDNKHYFRVKINGEEKSILHGETIHLNSGERVTLMPNMYHEFYPVSDECIIGEVSTANDDTNDNFFTNSDIGRYSAIEEDEPAIVKLVSDK